MFYLDGDLNDYVGKGFFGGKIIVKLLEGFNFVLDDNVIIGNVVFYGVISGEVYINGCVGECFVVWNSGVNVVVEGIGDYGCEYMIGGSVVVFGDVGKNFVVGMFGGIVYVFVEDVKVFKCKCNFEMILFELLEDEKEIE